MENSAGTPPHLPEWRRRAEGIASFGRRCSAAAWIIARPKLQWLVAWAQLHKVRATIGAVALATMVILLSKHADPFRNYPSPEQYAAATQSSPAKPEALTSPAQPATQTTDPAQTSPPPLHDPNASDAPPEDKRSTTLNNVQLQQLVMDLDVLSGLLQAYTDDGQEYDATELTLAGPNIKTALYNRIKSGKAFEYPELSVRWSEFVEASREDLWNKELARYCASRVEQIQNNILARRFPHGDTEFVAEMIPYFAGQLETLTRWVNRARRLKTWLFNDQILDDNLLTDGQEAELPAVETLLSQLRAGARLATPLSRKQQGDMMATIDALKCSTRRPHADDYKGPSQLEQMDHNVDCYQRRRRAFKDLIPFIDNAVSQRGFNDLGLRGPLRELLSHRVGMIPPSILKLNSKDGESKDRDPQELQQPILVAVAAVLTNLRQTAFVGNATSKDLKSLNDCQQWMTETQLSLEKRQTTMDGMVDLIHRSGDPVLVAAIGAVHQQEWQQNGVMRDFYRAQFSRDGFAKYDAGAFQYPIRDASAPAFPDFGAEWNSDGVPR